MLPEKEMSKEAKYPDSNSFDLETIKQEICSLAEKLKKSEHESKILMGAYFLTDERFKNDTRISPSETNSNSK